MLSGETNLNGNVQTVGAIAKGYGIDLSARVSGSPFRSNLPLQGTYTAFTIIGGLPLSVSFSFASDASGNWALSSAVGTGASLFIGSEIGFIHTP